MRDSTKSTWFFSLIAAASVITPSAGWCQMEYQVKPILKLGDRVGSQQTQPESAVLIGSLNDRGQLIFSAASASGGQLLLKHTNGQTVVVATPGGAAPAGKWPQSLFFFAPISMNQSGAAVFAAPATLGATSLVGTFLLDDTTHTISTLARDGMPATDGLVFGEGGGPSPVINNHGDIAFSAAVRDATGRLLGYGVFLLSQDGRLQAVALPGQTLADGDKITTAYSPSLDDTGTVAFMAVTQEAASGDSTAHIAHATATGRSPFLWENGKLLSLPEDQLTAAADLPPLGFAGVWLNNKNRNVLLTGLVNSPSGVVTCPYLLANGQLRPVALPNAPMPGGGNFVSLQDAGISFADELGRHAILALLDDGSTAAYRMDPNGSLTLILKSGTTTDLGPVTNVGQGTSVSRGVSLNSQGQVALTLRIADRDDWVVVLTPPSP